MLNWHPRGRSVPRHDFLQLHALFYRRRQRVVVRRFAALTPTRRRRRREPEVRYLRRTSRRRGPSNRGAEHQLFGLLRGAVIWHVANDVAATDARVRRRLLVAGRQLGRRRRQRQVVDSVVLRGRVRRRRQRQQVDHVGGAPTRCGRRSRRTGHRMRRWHRRRGWLVAIEVVRRVIGMTQRAVCRLASASDGGHSRINHVRRYSIITKFDIQHKQAKRKLHFLSQALAKTSKLTCACR